MLNHQTVNTKDVFILYYPYYPLYRKSNPYIDLFYNIFPEYCEIKSGVPWNYKNIDKKYKKKIFHLHWEHLIYSNRSKQKAAKENIDNFLNRLNKNCKQGWKFIWTIHNEIPHNNKFPELDIYLRNELNKLADVVIVHSNYIKNLLKERYNIKEEKFRTIYHGIYNNYINEIKKEQARKYFNIPLNSKVFLNFGKLLNYKGIDHLLEAFSNSKIQEHNTFLIIAGQIESSFNKKLLNKYTGNSNKLITKYEYIPSKKIQYYFNAADFSVFPYKRILTSGSMFLSYAFEKPMIIPSLPSFENYDINEGCIKYKASNILSLTDALKQSILLNDKEYNNLVNKTKIIKETHDWKKLTPIIENIINEL